MSDKLRGRQNDTQSPLVLHTAERDRGRNNEPTGEAESLWGKIGSRKFGDRAVVRERDPELEEKLKKFKEKSKKKKDTSEHGKKKSKKDFFQNLDDTYVGGYRPKTKETGVAYDQILSFVSLSLGDLQQEVVRSAAEEILAILKTEGLKAPEKKKEIETLIGTISEGQFADVVDIAKKITDYSDVKDEGEQIDDETGVAVVFDEDEDEEDFELRDEEDEDEGQETTDLEGFIHAEDDKQDMDTDEDPYFVDAKSIGAFWVKSEITKKVDPDPINSQKLSEHVLKLLELPDEREVEHQLAQLLDYSKFEFVKLLLKNRLKIIYCTKLARAENELQKSKIEEEMKLDPALNTILESLHSTGKSKLGEKAGKKEKSIKTKDKSTGDGKSRNIIDLEAISFQTGGHFMSNKSVQLPKETFKKQMKGYEEIHIPAPKTPPFQDNERLIPVTELPSWAVDGFPGMKTFNRIQSRIFKCAFQSHENMLVAAPTGAGKTNVAMLTVMREIGLALRSDGTVDLDNFKIIYVAPMKALVQEIVQNFSNRLKSYGIVARELTGDSNLTKAQIKETQIIVTTPEKWDIITRKSGDRTYTQNVKLIIIDEIHLLHDDRGPVLESLVARTLRQIESTQENTRLVGLSATLPNYEDVATFLRVQPTGLFVFNGAYRPCPLEQQYVGVTEKSAHKRYQLMSDITYEKVLEQAGKNQVLVFVHSRKETVRTAKALRDTALAQNTLGKFMKDDAASKEILKECSEKTAKNADLKEIIAYGFGVHHAGLPRSDRELVENLFAAGHIQVLVSTATLAWGVNLPAHTVIIKGTQIYSPEKGRWTELSPLDVMQMFGRAGRPAFDTFGEGILITTRNEMQYYLTLLNQQLPIESQYISKLVDHLNAEVVLGTVQNVDEAVHWLGYTYLFVRMLKNPGLYGVTADEMEKDPELEQRRRDLIHTAATILDKSHLIKYDRKVGSFQPTDLGIVASHYYVNYTTMNVFNEHLKPSMNEIELFRVFSLSGEFKYMTVRNEEKVEMEKLLQNVPIPIKETIDDPPAKVNVLLQAFISKLKLDGFALVSDMVYVTQSGGRLLRAFLDIALKRGWAQLAERVLDVCKMVDKRMWASQTPLRQFGAEIPEAMLSKLEKKDFPFERLYDLNAQELGELVNYAAFGKELHKLIHHFPKLELTAHVQPVTRSLLKVELTITPDFKFDSKYHQQAEPFWVLVEDADDEKLLHYEYFLLKEKFADQEHVLSFTVPLFEPLHPHYTVKLISDRWIGAQTNLPVSFRHLLLPEKFPMPTELLDLKPTPLGDLKKQEYMEFFAAQNIKQFNSIQTQVFDVFYGTDSNALLCAPTGSGKTVCAELAMLRLFSSKPDGKAVYVGPYRSICNSISQRWSATFGKMLNKTVSMLSGDIAQDLKYLEKSNIIISTPENWDVLSRRWKQRKNVQNIDIFIVDEIHLIGGEPGPSMEVILSRMRYMVSQGHKVRIIGLGASVANARELGEWMGASHSHTFNFHPSSRPVSLELHIQGFDAVNFGSRMMAMTRPTLQAISHHAKGKPTIIFVPNRKVARQLARDVMTYVDLEDPHRTFLKGTEAELTPYLERAKNPMFIQALRSGIALHHEALSDTEKLIATRLFKQEKTQVMIATFNTCWELDVFAHLVVIMGSQFYDGKEHRYSDYALSDILQMLGRASRPQDQISKCAFFCFGPKKEFYKKFLFEPLPVESHLDHFLADHINAEIVTKTIENKQDAVDYLTWTFLYKRLVQNPNYYNMQGTSHSHISDWLSELVEQTLTDLEQSKCITIEDDTEISPLNLGVISCHYNIKYTTIELFQKSLNPKIKYKGFIEILSAASEFDHIPIRHGEYQELKKLGSHLPLKIDKPNYAHSHTKVNVLLQSYLSRRVLRSDFIHDQNYIVENASRLLQALVDVISSSSWLTPALAAMELSQMITQSVWSSEILKQIPHFTDEILARCKSAQVESVYDIADLDDDVRAKILKDLTPAQMQDVAKFCNRYPSVDVKYSLESSELETEETGVVAVELERDLDENEQLSPVVAPFYPKEKAEGWWLVVGDVKNNKLLSIKRVFLNRNYKAQLEFNTPSEPGQHTLTLYLMCDSYLACDQEFEFTINVKPGNPKAEVQAMDDN